MKILISIQSVSDVITNSSSELFLISREDKEVDEIDELLQRIGEENMNLDKDRSSGMGGELTVYTPETWQNYVEESIKEAADEWGVSEDVFRNCIVIDIDHARVETIKFIKENFKIISEDW